ncbi:hypothetical protein sphantq_04518 (plasmid) [Sphingobium sp. AntQ-1]|nr:hypothetical protein sphantq_04518 [Sphingobium sp. AntQ-1]
MVRILVIVGGSALLWWTLFRLAFALAALFSTGNGTGLAEADGRAGNVLRSDQALPAVSTAASVVAWMGG